MNSPEKKRRLIEVLNENHLIKDGVINEIPIDQFIHVVDTTSQPFTQDMWNGQL